MAELLRRDLDHLGAGGAGDLQRAGRASPSRSRSARSAPCARRAASTSSSRSAVLDGDHDGDRLGHVSESRRLSAWSARTRAERGPGRRPCRTRVGISAFRSMPAVEPVRALLRGGDGGLGLRRPLRQLALELRDPRAQALDLGSTRPVATPHRFSAIRGASRLKTHSPSANAPTMIAERDQQRAAAAAQRRPPVGSVAVDRPRGRIWVRSGGDRVERVRVLAAVGSTRVRHVEDRRGVEEDLGEHLPDRLDVAVAHEQHADSSIPTPVASTASSSDRAARSSSQLQSRVDAGASAKTNTATSVVAEVEERGQRDRQRDHQPREARSCAAGSRARPGSARSRSSTSAKKLNSTIAKQDVDGVVLDVVAEVGRSG